AHFLSVHLCERYDRFAHATLLDKHGRRGDYDAGRRTPDRCRSRMDFAQRLYALLKRIHSVLLGGWYVVDSFTVHTWLLEACLQEISSELRPAVLGHGLSLWYVHSLYVPTIEGDQLPVVTCHTTLLHLSGACRLVHSFARSHLLIGCEEAWLMVIDQATRLGYIAGV